MSSIMNITEAGLEQDVYKSSKPVLLDLWAPWCAPCKMLAPNLERLSSIAGDSITIAKLDVDTYPDVMARLGIRGIPALLLFKNGEIISREVGTKSLKQLKEWLEQHDVALSPQENAGIDTARYPAFYGDESLKNFMSERLLAHAEVGNIQLGVPFWQDGVGTPSAALVHSADPAVFERLTGLPVSFSKTFDFVSACKPQELRPILDALNAGTDLNLSPLHLLHKYLSAADVDWTGMLIDSPVANQLRLDWIQQTQSYLSGASDGGEFKDLAARAAQLDSDNDKALKITGDLIKLLCPPPPACKNYEWEEIFNLAGLLTFNVGQHMNGWSKEDRHTEERRHAWFSERLEKGPDSTFTEAELEACQQQWESENQEYQRKEQHFFENNMQGLDQICGVLQSKFVEVLTQAPAFKSSESED